MESCREDSIPPSASHARFIHTHLRHQPIPDSRSDFLQTEAILSAREHGYACIVLDLPGCDRDTTAAFFCDAICAGDFRDLRFAFDGIDMPRVILSGPMEQILDLVNSYKSSR